MSLTKKNKDGICKKWPGIYFRNRSNEYQITAHRKNKYLFKPSEGMHIRKLSDIGVKRTEEIIKWTKTHENFEELKIELDDILGSLRFGVIADRFERAFENLGKILGFISQRPDKEWNQGPDNLWKMKDNQYLLVECKNMVYQTRESINKTETGQMNNAGAWFNKNYGDMPVKRIMIIHTKKVNPATGFNFEVEIMKKNNLEKLTRNVESFYNEFQNLDLNDLSREIIQKFLDTHKLSVESLLSEYSEMPITN
jgi:hypothetical protein